MSHFALGLLRYGCGNHHKNEILKPSRKRLDHEIQECIVCLNVEEGEKTLKKLREKRGDLRYKGKIVDKDEDNNINNDRSVLSGSNACVFPNWKFICVFGCFVRTKMQTAFEQNQSDFSFFAVDDLSSVTKDFICSILGNDTEFGNFDDLDEDTPFVKTPRPKDPHDVLPEGVEKTRWWLEAIFTHPDHPVAGYEEAQWSQAVFPDEDDEEKEVKAGHLRSGRKRRQNEDDDEYQPSEDSESEDDDEDYEDDDEDYEDDDEDYEDDDEDYEDESSESEDEELVEKKCKLESVGCVSEDGVIDLTTEDYGLEENAIEDDYNEQIRLGRLVRFVEQFPIYYHNPANLHRDLKKVLDQLSSHDS